MSNANSKTVAVTIEFLVSVGHVNKANDRRGGSGQLPVPLPVQFPLDEDNSWRNDATGYGWE